MRAQLRPRGRVAVVEARPGGLWRRIFGHHTDPAVIRAEMAQAGYRLAAAYESLPSDSFQVFTPVPDGDAGR
jgi:hypothetical protein